MTPVSDCQRWFLGGCFRPWPCGVLVWAMELTPGHFPLRRLWHVRRKIVMVAKESLAPQVLTKSDDSC